MCCKVQCSASVLRYDVDTTSIAQHLELFLQTHTVVFIQKKLLLSDVHCIQ